MTIRLGSFIKSIESKKLKRIRTRRDVVYIYEDRERNGLSFEINATTGQFAIFVDNVGMDDSQPKLTMNLDIQIDDISAENVVAFKDVKRRKHAK